MNKIWLFGAAISMVLAFGSCKPKQSAYKAAYEQAKEKESTAPVEVVEQEEEIVEEVAPVSKPRTSTATTRSERISAAQGEDASRLKRYSVVIGSFKNKTNAYSLKREILNFTNKISKKLSKPDRKFTADMTYGMLASGSCLLTDVVDQLHETSRKVNSVERLTRHLNKGTPAKALNSYLSVIRKWQGQK